jgi:hypothetical protein
VFAFAPDAVPLYSFLDTGGVATSEDDWPDHVAWPQMRVVDSQPGSLHLKSAAFAHQDDGLVHTFYPTASADPSAPPPPIHYDSGPRNVKVICLPINFAISDLRAIEGRAIALKFTVNGSLAAELSTLRFSRPQYLATVADSQVHLDTATTVDILTGSLRQTLPLFGCHGPGLPMQLALFYSSEGSVYYRDAAREPEKKEAIWTPFGHGWGFTYGLRVLGNVAAPERLDNLDGSAWQRSAGPRSAADLSGIVYKPH